MNTVLIFVSIKTQGLLYAKAPMAPAVYLPMPGNFINSSSEDGKEKSLETPFSYAPTKKSSETRRSPVKRVKYLDMSIQDWSETDSSKPDSLDSSFLEIGSFEKDTFEIE